MSSARNKKSSGTTFVQTMHLLRGKIYGAARARTAGWANQHGVQPITDQVGSDNFICGGVANRASSPGLAIGNYPQKQKRARERGLKASCRGGTIAGRRGVEDGEDRDRQKFQLAASFEAMAMALAMSESSVATRVARGQPHLMVNPSKVGWERGSM